MLKVQQAADRRFAELCSYSVDRRYTVGNKRLVSNAVMNVHMVYRQGAGKHFETPSMPDVHGLVRYSLLNLMKEEEKTSKEHDADSRLNSANYDFTLLGMESLETRNCYRIQIKPRHKSKYLIDGQMWVDANEYAVVQIKGQLAQRPSLWVHQPTVEQYFSEIQKFWLPSYNRSLADITFVGKTLLTIEYSNYKVNSCATGSVSR